MSDQDDELLTRFLDWRGVETMCPTCTGAGSRTYSNTAQWRRGAIAGQMMTVGVCDTCWGSGDLHRPWVDLRRLEEELRMLRKKVTELERGDK
jgi:hypothetical protein